MNPAINTTKRTTNKAIHERLKIDLFAVTILTCFNLYPFLISDNKIQF